MDALFRKTEKLVTSLVDHVWVRIIIITLLVVYNSGLFVDYNMALSPILNNTILRLVLLILVVHLIPKNPTIAILLVLTLACSSYYRSEHYENEGDEEDEEESEDDEHFTENKKNQGNKNKGKGKGKGKGNGGKNNVTARDVVVRVQKEMRGNQAAQHHRKAKAKAARRRR